MKIEVIQTNPFAKGIEENASEITKEIRAAKNAGFDAICFSAQAFGAPSGELGEDLARLRAALKNIKQEAAGITVILGAFDRDGEQIFLFRNHVELKGRTVEHKGLTAGFEPRATKKTKTFVWLRREPFFANRSCGARALGFAISNDVNLVCVNKFGFSSGRVYEGGSFIFKGGKLRRAEVFARQRSADFKSAAGDLELKLKNVQDLMPKPGYEEILGALVFSLRSYAAQNGFTQALVGLSGGVDSALVCALAVLALGRENVKAVFMPSVYTSDQSRKDATDLANVLKIELEEIAIDKPFKAFTSLLDLKGTARENIQARIRGNILMAISNTSGALVLATSNKSELSTGYCTLYGDLLGGFAPISDLFKRDVYALCDLLSKRGIQIPQSILSKAPTAELSPGQKDSDALGSYKDLDLVLDGYLLKGLGVQELSAFADEAYIQRILALFARARHKREQAPHGVKIYKQNLS